jgi:hypothetical protein
MLYFADVADKIGVVTTLLSSVFFIATALGGLAVGGTRVENPGRSEYWAPLWMLIVPFFLFFFFVSFAILVPSKNTIYLIAGSEIGETVVRTPEAQQMLSDIREVIQSQLKDLKKE